MDDHRIDPPARLWRLPQTWETMGRFLPRLLLDWTEIHARPQPVSASSVRAAVEFWRERRVALVKQTAYQALYARPHGGDWLQTALSAACHLGPLAFLDELRADFHIVRQDRDPETFLWKEKFSRDPDPRASVRRQQDKIDRWESSPAGRRLPAVDDIAWDQYDLVVGLDVPIPSRIARKCPRTAWAYYSLEAGGPLQKNSLARPVEGYQIFLNHGFRRYRSRPANRPHVIEFPLQFQSAQNWRQIHTSVPTPARNHPTILVERHSHESPRPKSHLPLVYLEGKDSLPKYLAHLFSAHFAIQTTPKVRWGNWAVETILAGALFLGNPSSLAMISPLLPGLEFHSLAPAVSLANRLAAHPAEWAAWQRLQRDLTEEVCFRRPLLDLTRRARGKRP